MSKFFKALEQAKRERLTPTDTPAPAASPDPPSVPATIPEPAPVPAASHEPAPPATIPEPPAEIPQGLDAHLVSLLTPGAFEAEQYRSLRHTMEQLHKTGGLQIIAVTSAAVGDGKTTTAINLAGALAQASGARVLLVDADLRRPALGRLLGFGGAGGLGLVSAIVDPAIGLRQVIHDRPPFSLSVICAGQSPASPYELLQSPRLGALLDEARGRFDYVIVDCPPLVSVQDCRVIARWVDGFLLVVQAHRTPRRLVEEAFNVVDPSKIIGLVFNGGDDPLSGYSSGYDGGYGPAPDAGTNGHGASPWQRAVKNVKKMSATLRSRKPRP